jgi:hypothetical protein
MMSTSGEDATKYGFIGEMQKSYIKLIDLRSQWYDPAIAGFPSHDT